MLVSSPGWMQARAVVGLELEYAVPTLVLLLACCEIRALATLGILQ